MFHRLLAVFLFVALAGRVLSLELSVVGKVGNITSSQILMVTPGPYTETCVTQCNTANSTILSCAENASCLCTQDVVNQLTACEQCMFDVVVAKNLRVSDVLVGSNALLSDFTTACNASTGVTLTAALKIAPGFEGSNELLLNTGATVVVVGIGSIIGGGALWLLTNMS